MARKVIARQSPTITASAAYSAGNAVGGKLTFTNVASGGDGKLVSLSIADKSGQGVALNLLLFNQDFTATVDKNAIAISAADQLHLIGCVAIATTDYVSVGTGKTATKANVNLILEGVTGNDVYGQLVTTGTPTYASTSDIQVTLHSEVDRAG